MWWPFKKKHKHEWRLISSSIGGWNTYKCWGCGRTEIS